jgi:hypothetical protein
VNSGNGREFSNVGLHRRSIVMTSSQSDNTVLTVGTNNSDPVARPKFLLRRLRRVLNELDKREAYRRIDELFAEQGKLFELMEVIGIHDVDILQRFLSLGFTPRTAPAIEMVPIAFVAWASDEVTDDECAAAVSAIYNSQLTEFPETWAVVQTWLDIRPDRQLWDLWKEYMLHRLGSMPIEQRKQLHQQLLNHVRHVARASGGWMGIGSICREEQFVIDEINSLFLAD